ncbi:MAG: suppressor of fused domain protein [Oscillospiraceae bacterium]
MPRPAHGRSTCWPSWRATRSRPAISSSRARTSPATAAPCTRSWTRPSRGWPSSATRPSPRSRTVHGRVAFLQLVGLTQPELDAVTRDPDTLTGILERMRAENPELVLDMRRTRSYV